jgi:coenzyme PQQ synthesis protein D (PqqD)
MPPYSFKPKARSRQLVTHQVSDETLVYDLNSNKAHCLNHTAAFVWSVCDGDNTVAAIAGLAQDKFGAPINEEFIELALDQLNESELLEDTFRVSPKLPRRQWIKRVGLTSVVALPVIASLVAPQNALAAQSCNCVNPGECLTQTSCPSTVNCNGSGLCAP